MPNEVFLSHASQDVRLAQQVADVLRKHGVPTFFSATKIRGSQQWHDEIGSALARCDWFLLLLSPHAVKSKWVKRELMYALINDQYECRIVPVLLKSCRHEKLSWTLSAYQFIDLSADFEEGCRDLLRTWGLGLKR